MSEHTPRPWGWDGCDLVGGPRARDRVTVIMLGFPGNLISDEDKAFIVLACNSHDEMAAALEAIAEEASFLPRDASLGGDTCKVLDSIQGRAEAVLAKVSHE